MRGAVTHLPSPAPGLFQELPLLLPLRDPSLPERALGAWDEVTRGHRAESKRSSWEFRLGVTRVSRLGPHPESEGRESGAVAGGARKSAPEGGARKGGRGRGRGRGRGAGRGRGRLAAHFLLGVGPEGDKAAAVSASGLGNLPALAHSPQVTLFRRARAPGRGVPPACGRAAVSSATPP